MPDSAGAAKWSSLAPELWGRASLHLRPRGFMRLLICSRNIVQQHERDRLWHFFCHFEGFARAVDEGDPWLNTVAKRPCLKWQRVFEQNADAEAKPGKFLFTWVRLGSEEVRIAVSQEEAVADMPEHQELPRRLAEQNLFSPTLLHAKLQSLLSDEEAVPRLRDLTVGRPGPALCVVGFYQGASSTKVLAEWPSVHALPWRPARALLSVATELRPGSLSPFGVSRPDGWLVELLPQQGNVNSAWLQVAGMKLAADVTVRDLCKAVSAQLPGLGFLAKHVWLASAQDPQRPADNVELGLALLRDLRWTQSERLLLREVRLPGTSAWPRWADSEENELLRPQEAQPLVLLERCSQRPVPTPADRPFQLSAALAEELALSGPLSRSSTYCRSSPSSSGRRRKLEEPGEVAHSRRLLLTSRGARQFEFHPLRPGTMLVGRKDGTAGIINYDSDVMSHSCVVDQFPILGLSWFHTLPQWAVVGGSQSGVIRFLRYDEGLPGKLHSVELEPFQQLSSLSVNCTDDYFMTSGFCIDVGLYDVVTGRRIKTFRNLHQNFINILRFSHRTPQLFATASFDHTCKVWDLRDPSLNAQKPVACCNTDTLNVMCCFSPDDSRLLVSGVDEALRQFDLRERGPGSKFPVPALGSSINYRRSLYAAGGEVVATVATNESLLRLYDAAAPHKSLGVIDFRNMLLKQNHRQAHGTGQAGCFFPWTSSRSSRWSALSLVGGSSCEEPREGLDQAPRVEYLQSLRCHPGEPSILGALAAASEPSPEAYVAAIHLEEKPGASDECFEIDL